MMRKIKNLHLYKTTDAVTRGAVARTQGSRRQSLKDKSSSHFDSAAVYSVDELSAIDRDRAFLIPSPERLDEIQQNAAKQMRTAATAIMPCSVCELDNDPDDIVVSQLTSTLLTKMKRCLAVPHDNEELPPFIISQYDVSSLSDEFKGLLLFPPAIQRSDGNVTLQICRSCLQQLQNSTGTIPPTLSIANGNFMGRLPERFKLTRTDEQAVALLSPCMSISTVTGGPCRTIKSHHYVVENTQGPIADMLPSTVETGVRVAMVGCMTRAQVAACKKRYALNVPLCREVLEFLYANNREYKWHRERHTRKQLEAQLQLNASTTVVVDKTTPVTEPPDSQPTIDEIWDDSTYSRFGSTVQEGEDSALEAVWEEKSNLLIQPNRSQENARTDILVRKSNKYVTMKKWEGCVKMFPTLFPGGCGGPLEPRQRYMSVKKWIRRCLRVHGHRFEEHYAFMLLAFNYMASENARQSLFIKLHVSSTALMAAEIKRSTIKAAMKYFNLVNECKARGMHPGRPPADVERVIQLRRGLHTPESAFYGSNLSRMRARHDLFGMLKRFGPVQLFFTVSPDSAGSYSVAIKPGKLSEQVVRESNIKLLPNRAERRAIAAQHPVECARYFLRVMDTVINEFLGWDQNRGRPRRGGGIFGAVRAFSAAAETQIAGDLHAHFVVWMYGFPQTSTQLHTVMKRDQDFRARLLLLADAVLTTKPPCLDDEQSCPSCNEHDVLTSILPGVDAFRRPAPGASPPITARCSNCGTTFSDKDVIGAAIEALAKRDDVDISAQMCDFNRCRPPEKEVTPLAISLIVRDVQIHFWNHAKSCFKVTVQTPKGSVCRFFKPEETHLGSSMIDDDLNIRLHRPVGCEYANPYNKTLISVLKCNHDVKFVECSETKNTAACVCKYCMKHQNPVENYVVLSIAAFARAAEKADQLPPESTPLERGRKILGSMLYSITNGLEIAAPMAALYILRGSPFWFSHDPIRVDGTMLRPRADSGAVEITVSPESCRGANGRRKIRRSQTLLEKYHLRDASLSSIPFIDFCEWYDHSATAKHEDEDEDTIRPVSPPTHLVRSKRQKVFVFCGHDIPDDSVEMSKADKNFYYEAMLTLFMPHREPTGAHFVAAAYQDFVENGDSILVQRMYEFEDRLRDFHKADMSDTSDTTESMEERILRSRPAPSTEWAGLETDPLPPPTELEEDELMSNVTNDDPPTTSAQLSTERLADGAHAAVNVVPNLRSAIDNAVAAYPTTEPIFVNGGINIDRYSELVVKASLNDAGEEHDGTDLFIRSFADAPTRLNKFRECFEPVPWRPYISPQQWTPTSLPAFPPIAMVSEAFHLNFCQHVIFEVAARHLLFAYSTDISTALREPMYPRGHVAQPYQLKHQLVAYLSNLHYVKTTQRSQVHPPR